MTVDDADGLLGRAAELAAASVREGGRPFGAVVARHGDVLGEGTNRVLQSGDPSAHAEMEALRAAARAVGSERLTGCVVYSSCEPCPMCMAACYWADVAEVVYGATRADAAAAGFDTATIYEELGRPPSERRIPGRFVPSEPAGDALQRWKARSSGTDG